MKKNIKNLVKSAVLGMTVLALAVSVQSFTAGTKVLAEDEAMWGRTENGVWEKLESPAEQDANCVEDTEICKAIYLEGFSPDTGTSADPGFLRVHEADGYIELP